MPLASGSGKRVISGNIRELMHAYAKKGAIGTSHPADAKAAQKQAIAIAYSKSRKRAAGGRLQPMADGGTPFYARQGAAALAKSGMIHSAIAGRTDKLPMKVRGGSYVVPADVVSGLGQGNSLAGAAGFDKMLKSGPYGADKSPGVHVKAKAIRQKFADGGAPVYEDDGGGGIDITKSVGRNVTRNEGQGAGDIPAGAPVAPRASAAEQAFAKEWAQALRTPYNQPGKPLVWPERPMGSGPLSLPRADRLRLEREMATRERAGTNWKYDARAHGGYVEHQDSYDSGEDHAEIIAAGGEYIIDPDQVRAIGGGDLKKGHDILDHMVLHARKKTIRQMRKLPRPKVK